MDFPVIHLDAETIDQKNLNAFTFARVGLPKAGFAISMPEILSFRADFAAAKDAITTPFEIEQIKNSLNPLGVEYITIASQATTRQEYLQRPDLGRVPDNEGLQLLESFGGKRYDVVMAITNGLSAQAVNENAGLLLRCLLPSLRDSGYTIAPLVFVNNGRVAIADIIGEVLQARLSVILVGERPGLSSPDSMGAYLTYAPHKGLTDEKRNCISNIRAKGLPPAFASEKLLYLITESLTRKLSGVHLKDEMFFLGN